MNANENLTDVVTECGFRGASRPGRWATAPLRGVGDWYRFSSPFLPPTWSGPPVAGGTDTSRVAGGMNRISRRRRLWHRSWAGCAGPDSIYYNGAVKNNRGHADQDPTALGPEPAAPQTDLTPAVAFVREHLASQAGAVTISALAAMTGLHQNTLREHLDQLVEAGAATKTKAASTGRGRPAWLYRATNSPRTGTSEYLGLASVLAAHIDRTSANPREDGIAAGIDWGRDLAREAAEERAAAEAEPGDEVDPADAEAEPADGDAASSSAPEGISAAEETVTLLDELGFAPEPVGDDASPSVGAPTERHSFRLTRCPLLEAAHEHPDIVCGVHLGLVRGALEVCGDPAAESELEPFSDPGACRLHLRDSTAGPVETLAGTDETATPKSGRTGES